MRLTTNKEVSDMNMTELEHNCCYARDGLARYRDYETDVNARDFTRDLMVKYDIWTEEDDAISNDEVFDEKILAGLMTDPSTNIEGLIARFYKNICSMAGLREELKVYEDATERGAQRYKVVAKYDLELDNTGIRWLKGREYDCIYNHGAYELSSENGTTFYPEYALEKLEELFDFVN